MKRAQTREWHFRRREGSSATRANSQGDSEFGAPMLGKTLAKQLDDLLSGAGTEQEFNRMGGHLRKTLRNEQRDEFERIFVNVANARLPKDVFLAIQEEARSIWRGQFTNLVPPDHRQLKNIRKLRRKQAHERGEDA